MGYYSLQDAASDAQRLPLRFSLDIPGLGYLEGNPGGEIEKGLVVNLPMWLALVLAVCEVSEGLADTFVELVPPECFGPKVLNAVRALPVAVDLHAVMPHYYRMAQRWSAMFGDEELVGVVVDMLRERAWVLNDYGQNGGRDGEAGRFVAGMDEWEKEMWRVVSGGYKRTREYLG